MSTEEMSSSGTPRYTRRALQEAEILNYVEGRKEGRTRGIWAYSYCQFVNIHGLLRYSGT